MPGRDRSPVVCTTINVHYSSFEHPKAMSKLSIRLKSRQLSAECHLNGVSLVEWAEF